MGCRLGNAVYTWETNHYPTKQEVMDYMHDMDKDFYQGIYEERDLDESNLTYQEWFDANYNHADENYIGDREDHSMSTFQLKKLTNNREYKMKNENKKYRTPITLYSLDGKSDEGYFYTNHVPTKGE